MRKVARKVWKLLLFSQLYAPIKTGLIRFLITTANSSNGAISLTQTLNRILVCVCNRRYLRVQKEKKRGSGNDRPYCNLNAYFLTVKTPSVTLNACTDLPAATESGLPPSPHSISQQSCHRIRFEDRQDSKNDFERVERLVYYSF